MKKWIAVVFLLCVVPFSEASDFQGLGGLSYKGDGTPYSVSSALGISADGSTVVGESWWVAGQTAHGEACYWDSSGVHEIVGGTAAYGASANGSVIVGRGLYSSDVGFRTDNGVATSLGGVVTDSYNNWAQDVSADGSIVVGHSSESTQGYHAARWQSGGITDLGLGRAYGVSANGSVIVGQMTSPSNLSFRWTASSGMVALNGLPGGGAFSNATAVSSSGQVIVGWSNLSSDIYGAREAYRWDNGFTIGLGDLPGGTFWSWANDVSVDGSIIVGYSVTDGDLYQNGTTAAFIWDNQHGMRNLQDILVGDFGLNMTGWSLREATGVSDDGMVIVGKGVNPDGFEQGWIATIPEPATLLLLGVGGIVLRRRR